MDLNKIQFIQEILSILIFQLLNLHFQDQKDLMIEFQCLNWNKNSEQDSLLKWDSKDMDYLKQQQEKK